MPRIKELSRPRTISDVGSITPASLFELLAPSLQTSPGLVHRHARGLHQQSGHVRSECVAFFERIFYSSLSRAATCHPRQAKPNTKNVHFQPCSRLHSGLTLAASSNRKRTSNSRSITEKQWRCQSSLRALDGQPDPGGTSTQSPHAVSGHSAPRGFFDSQAREFAAESHLPSDFFNDVHNLQNLISRPGSTSNKQGRKPLPSQTPVEQEPSDIKQQLQLLDSVRNLEAKLAKAKDDLRMAMQRNAVPSSTPAPGSAANSLVPVTLSKDDYIGLVDLYYYTQKNRFSPESPDASPTPLFEDYSFKLSEDFSSPGTLGDYIEDDEPYESPLKQVEELLKSRQIREIAVMQAFVNLLLDDHSSNKALFEVYKKFPEPGVAFLPKSVIRLFLQRMSTPRVKSEKSMIRYLSLIDDMQKAGIPIRVAEWSSAIHLAGRSFAKVSKGDLANAFKIWRQMEQEAGVSGSHVTFNILFDIAMRAGQFVLAETVLKEMHDRGLRLNRLGRVNLIHYHGLRGDGDGVRKAYRDFVEAGEIVDTLVLNCVIASLLNAQEPTAAEQVYERMKNLQARLQTGQRSDGKEVLYMRYPPPGSVQIGHEMASKSLGRILLRAFNLRKTLPEHHRVLQNSMPLRPDHITFRSMISYHANRSGDLDRLTVLLNEMTELFNLSFTGVMFQLMFKGFALHGALGGSDKSWNSTRLDLVWAACREGIKDAQNARRHSHSKDEAKPTLPSITELEQMDEEERTRPLEEGSNAVESVRPTKLKRLSSWDDFVLDLAAFPRERRKPIERVHAELFDDEPADNKKRGFSNPFFQEPSKAGHSNAQQTYYRAGDPNLDHDEGEYILPSPEESISPGDSARAASSDEGASEDESESERYASHEIRATRQLVCWLLRAYTRCTGSRARVEEVWNSARKLWRPLDVDEKESVLRVLRRCLRDCDRYRPPFLD